MGSRAGRTSWAGALALALTLTSMAGCGGGGLPADGVAEIAGKVITKQSFDHWLTVTAARDYELVPQRPLPRWVIPDPPGFGVCIAHLAASPTRVAAGSKASAAQLKAQCRASYRALRAQVLQSLVSGYWLIAEGEKRGLKARSADISRWLARMNQSASASPAAIARSRTYTGETLADQVLRAKIKAFSEKIEGQLTKNGGKSSQAYVRFIESFARKWAARTDCRAGYVVPGCRQYRGREGPEVRLL